MLRSNPCSCAAKIADEITTVLENNSKSLAVLTASESNTRTLDGCLEALEVRAELKDRVSKLRRNVEFSNSLKSVREGLASQDVARK
jgi:hypothetical protein